MSQPLSDWQNFYVIVGSSAGALTGLQFIVITLVAQSRAARSDAEIRAFGTPTVVQFTAALLIAAVMAAPWQTLLQLAICLGVCGGLGSVYSIRTIWHARNAAYEPDLEDWIWYTAIPLIAHLTLLACAILLPWNPARVLFAVAADTLLFLLVGIHNSWDTVTYIAVRHHRGPRTDEPDNKAASS